MIGFERFDDLEIRIHGHTHFGEVLVAIGQCARGFAHAHQIEVQAITDLSNSRRGCHKASIGFNFVGGSCCICLCLIRMLVNAAS
ncbi:unknown [Eggerthella sp. CAG:298]|nr:unknown [Eggerthella sp. CAG:298]